MSLRSKIAQLITSPSVRETKRKIAEKRRQRRGQAHKVVVYLRLNDAYSYVLLQVLASLAERYPIEYEFRTVLDLQTQMYPAPELWHKNAFSDGRYLAQLYDLKFPGQAPQSNTQRDRELTAQLLHWELQPGYLDKALALFTAYWNDDAQQVEQLVDSSICQHTECYQHHLQANQDLLQKQGHYLSAMLHYNGEWYWGLDRLEHLEQRLNTLMLNDESSDSQQQEQPGRIDYNLGHSNFCRGSAAADNTAKKEDTSPLTLYWSARSPYSYIGLVRAEQLCAHYQIPLRIKPVLPMVMRRMQVPKTKGRYILLDTKREAEKYGIPFGQIADPLGKGVERCYALFDYAATEGKEVAFALSFARGVWAEGIASDTDEGLEQIVSRAGLDWQHAKTLLQDQQWRNWAQDNLADMYSHDLWGVPSFKYQSLNLFGQDRLECLEQVFLAANATSDQASDTTVPTNTATI